MAARSRRCQSAIKPLGRTAQLLAKDVGVPIHGHRRNGDQRAAGVLSRSWIRTHRRLPVKTFMALVERNRGPSLGLRQLDDINTVEIICLPIGYDGRIATVIGDEKAGELWDRGV